MSYTIGRSNGNDRKYRVPNYSVTNQTISSPRSTTPTSPGSITTPNTSTMPGRGTTSPSTAPGMGTTPPAAPGTGTTTRTAPSTGTRTNPSTGTVLSPGNTPPRSGMSTTPTPGTGTGTMPGMGTTPTPGTGTDTMPGMGTSPTPGTGTGTRPGMGATPAPGTGTGTMPGMGAAPTPGTGTATMPGMGTTPTPGTTQPRPGMSTTPTPGTSQPRPGMISTPPPGTGTGTMPHQQPFIYGTPPGATTSPTGNGIPQSPSNNPLNPQSMAPPTQANQNNHQAMPQMVPNGMSGMPQQMPGLMPGTPVGMPSSMQPGLNQEMPYYNPTLPYMSGNMPYMSYPPYQGIPNMYVPNTNTYNVPMGIPLFPLYGYDNSADLDHDIEYMKQLYPRTAKAIQKEIDNECDQMEYDGSMMFDEYPDREYLDKLVDRVYDRIKQIEEEPQVEMNSLYFYPPRRNQNYLRDIVSLLLLSEIFNRRRRHRGRKRWF